jgi:hypothetical protein
MKNEDPHVFHKMSIICRKNNYLTADIMFLCCCKKMWHQKGVLWSNGLPLHVSGRSLPKTDKKDTCHSQRNDTLFVLHNGGDGTQPHWKSGRTGMKWGWMGHHSAHSEHNRSNNNRVGGRKQIFIPNIHSWRHLINCQTWLICGTGLCSILFYNRRHFVRKLKNNVEKKKKQQFISLDTKNCSNLQKIIL